MLLHNLFLLGFQFFFLTYGNFIEEKRDEGLANDAALSLKIKSIKFLKNELSIVKKEDVAKLLREKLRSQKYEKLGGTCPCALIKNGSNCASKCQIRNCKKYCEIPFDITTTPPPTTTPWPDLYEERYDVAIPYNPIPKPWGKYWTTFQGYGCPGNKNKKLENDKSSSGNENVTKSEVKMCSRPYPSVK